MITRDQERAQRAYACVEKVCNRGWRDDYASLVGGLGGQVVRTGLAATMAFLQRSKSPARDELLQNLADAGIPGCANSSGENLPKRIRDLPLDDYMLATREFLRVVQWLKRAAQALIQPAAAAGAAPAVEADRRAPAAPEGAASAADASEPPPPAPGPAGA